MTLDRFKPRNLRRFFFHKVVKWSCRQFSFYFLILHFPLSPAYPKKPPLWYLPWYSFSRPAYLASRILGAAITCGTPIWSYLVTKGNNKPKTSSLQTIGMKRQNRLGPIVRRPISAYPGVKFIPGILFLCSKAFSRIIFSVILRASNHQLVDKKN